MTVTANRIGARVKFQNTGTSFLTGTIVAHDGKNRAEVQFDNRKRGDTVFIEKKFLTPTGEVTRANVSGPKKLPSIKAEKTVTVSKITRAGSSASGNPLYRFHTDKGLYTTTADSAAVAALNRSGLDRAYPFTTTLVIIDRGTVANFYRPMR